MGELCDQRDRNARNTPQEAVLDASGPRIVICCDNLRSDNKKLQVIFSFP